MSNMAHAPDNALEGSLEFSVADYSFLEPYLPTSGLDSASDIPFVTLTYASSIDSSISLGPGRRTPLSGRASKRMTHYLRSKHDAILIGVGTAVADDPGLNCRLRGVGGYGGSSLAGQPVPVIIDPNGRWKFTRSTKLFQLIREGRGRPPLLVTREDANLSVEQQRVLQEHHGRQIKLPISTENRGTLSWKGVLEAILAAGLRSVMIEGGRVVIEAFLAEHANLVHSLIVTIAPTYLGDGALTILPRKDGGEQDAVARRINNVTWGILSPDAVLCGRLNSA